MWFKGRKRRWVLVVALLAMVAALVYWRVSHPAAVNFKNGQGCQT
ncbi:Uncharacterised protein [Serratia odorifera]|uniref:Uncharacterized protein n=1 Tax=Serratia odorifera TaxID=618 RepID=A0A3S4DTB5_SEROD|nr:Uncharacterised protein [Serratia odorifera]